MRIEDVRINSKFIAKDGTVHVAKAIVDAGIVMDENGEKFHCEDIEPVKTEPYLYTENGHTYLRVDSPQGTYSADIETREDVGKNVAYLMFYPVTAEGERQEDTCFQAFRLGDAVDSDGNVSDKDINLLAWGDITDSETPTLDTDISNGEIHDFLFPPEGDAER